MSCKEFKFKHTSKDSAHGGMSGPMPVGGQVTKDVREALCQQLRRAGKPLLCERLYQQHSVCSAGLVAERQHPVPLLRLQGTTAVDQRALSTIRLGRRDSTWLLNGWKRGLRPASSCSVLLSRATQVLLLFLACCVRLSKACLWKGSVLRRPLAQIEPEAPQVCSICSHAVFSWDHTSPLVGSHLSSPNKLLSPLIHYRLGQ